LVELRSGEFDLENKDGSTFELEVDFVDNAGGEDIGEYKVFIAFDDNNPDNGDDSTEPAEFKSFSPSDFDEGPNGNLGIDLMIGFQEAAQFTGVDIDEIRAGDRFQVTTQVVKEDGRVFGSDNSTPAITNAFGGIFDFNINATCPLPDGMFSGAYTVEYGEVYGEITFAGARVQAIGSAPLNRTVELSLVPGSTTRRTFPVATYLQPGYSFNAGDIVLDFACDQVSAGDIDAGAACGNGTIEAKQVTLDEFDLNDDSSFTITYTDFFDDGECGQAPLSFTLVFTKQ
jgi:hypothetical protein